MNTDLPQLTMQETIDEMRRLLAHFDEILLTFAEDDHNVVEELGRLQALGYIKQSIAETYKTMEAALIDDIDFQVELPGGMVAEKMTGAPRKAWQHQRLGQEVARRIVDSSVDMDTGEILKSTEEMITELLKYAAPSYWRVKTLKELGIDANKYAETGEAKQSIKITRKG